MPKIQIDIGSNNTQVSNDDSTTQVQIGNGAIITMCVIILASLIGSWYLVKYMLYIIGALTYAK